MLCNKINLKFNVEGIIKLTLQLSLIDIEYFIPLQFKFYYSSIEYVCEKSHYKLWIFADVYHIKRK